MRDYTHDMLWMILILFLSNLFHYRWMFFLGFGITALSLSIIEEIYGEEDE